MASLQSWRKAYGALKDTTTVSLANLNSDFKEIDVAIVKATNHVECPPKERYLRKILFATSAARPRADVAYCVRALSRRIAKTHNWTVALKALMLIHRILREGDPTFREELLVYTIKGRILQLSNFKDDSSPIAWDCSAWVRTYAQFLEERLECFRSLRYDVEAEPLIRPKDGTEKGHSRTRTLNTDELLEQLPVLQQLLHRLVGCQPEGVASNNYVIQYALALVLKESFKIYCAINDGIINLVDKFFEMPRHEAFKAVEIYRRAGQQAMELSEFYEVCRRLEMARNFQFPNLREPPPSFLATMEEYLKEAPRIVPITIEPLEFPDRLLLTYKPDDALPPPEEQPREENIKPVEESVAKPTPELEVEKPEAPTQKAEDVDLLGLGDFNAGASALEDSNALALAIVPTSTTSSSTTTQVNAFDPTGWELALVTSSSGLSTVETNLAGGLDKLTLDSLYDEGAHRKQNSMYGATSQNPFMANDPFALSNQIPAPPSVQMAAMAQQQHPFQPSPMMMQPNSFGQQLHPQLQMMPPSSNPFGDVGFGPFPTQPTHQQSNPFGNTGLL